MPLAAICSATCGRASASCSDIMYVGALSMLLVDAQEIEALFGEQFRGKES